MFVFCCAWFAVPWTMEIHDYFADPYMFWGMLGPSCVFSIMPIGVGAFWLARAKDWI
jgi:hypothetical protein